MTGDELKEYPCPYARGNGGREDWGKECQTDDDACFLRHACAALPVYRAQIKLRDDMRKLRTDHDGLRAAVLGDMPPEVAAYIYRNAAQLYGERANEEAKARFMALAAMVKGL